MKLCQDCGLEKDLNNYYKHDYTKDKLYPFCKKCHGLRSKKYQQTKKGKEVHLKASRKYKKFPYKKQKRKSIIERKYGINEKQYFEILEKQNFGCGICGNKYLESKNNMLCVDHCHNTKIVRGILCKKCNFALGLFKDNKESLLNALIYLGGI